MKRLLIDAVIFTLIFCTFFNIALAEDLPELTIAKLPEKNLFTNDEIIIKFSSDVTIDINNNNFSNIQSLNQLLKTLNITDIQPIIPKGETYIVNEIDGYQKIQKKADNSFIIKINNQTQLIPLINILLQNSHIEYAEPNFIYYTNSNPDDTYFSLQWGLSNINVPNAWNITEGNENITIAIIDTGVDWNHEDLANKIWINTEEIPNDGIDNDNNSYIDDVIGWDTVTETNCHPDEECDGYPDNDPNDIHGHGTHCAGIAAAETNNNLGIAGTCPECKIMAIRAGYKSPEYFNNVTNTTEYDGLLNSDDIIDAINYALTNNANIISMSFGAYNSLIYQDIANDLINANIIGVAAAGNENTNGILYPAGYDYIISVAAHNEINIATNFTNYGPSVNISLPGYNIASTYPDYTPPYAYMSGTSMATPMLAGAIGLMLDIQPNFTSGEIMHILNLTGHQINNFKNSSLSVPRPDIYAALAYLSFTAPEITDTSPSDSNATIDEGSSIVLSANASTNPGYAAYSTWNVDGTDVSFNTSTYNYTAGYTSAGSHIITYTIWDEFGSDSTSWNITVDDVPSVSITDRLPENQNITINETDSAYFTINTTSLAGNVSYSWSINSAERTDRINQSDFNFTTGYSSNGTYLIAAAVSNGIDNDTAVWNLTVMDKFNPAPDMNISLNTTVVERGSGSILIVYNVSDNNPDTIMFNITLAGSVINSSDSSTGSYTLSSLDQDGTYTVSLFANDTNNDSSSLQEQFDVIDTVIPDVNISINASRLIMDEDSLSFGINFSEDYIDMHTYNITYPDGSLLTEDTDGPLSVDDVLGTGMLNVSGDYMIAAYIIDEAGNNASSSASFEVISDLPPVITIDYPSEGEIFSDDNMTVMVSADKQVFNTTLHIGNISYLMDGNSTAWNYTFSGTGNQSFYVTATDILGNNGTSANRSIYLHDTVPQFTSSSPEGQDIIAYESEDIAFSIAYDDQGPEPVGITWFVEGIAQPENGTGFNFTTDYASEGTYMIDCMLNDSSSIAYRNWTLTVKDASESIIGDNDSVDTGNVGSLRIRINGSEDIIDNHTGSKKVNITDGSTQLLHFDHDFGQKRLDLRNLSILKQNSTAVNGYTVIKGLDTTSTKTIYIDRKNTSISSVCIKDAEVGSISEMSELCTDNDEFGLTCPEYDDDYNCTIQGSQFMIEGLRHSAVREQTYCGDGIRDGNEECDDDDLWNWTCSSLDPDYDSGAPSCSDGCTIQKGTCKETYVEEEGGSSGGGGGGGSGSSSGSYSSLAGPKYERYFNSLSSGLNEITIPDDRIPVKSLELRTGKYFTYVNIEVQKIDNKEALPNPPADAYAYLSIEAQNVQAAYLENVKHTLRIERSWLSDHDGDNVFLERYMGGSWVRYKAERIGEEGDYMLYAAETEGLSYFAITSQSTAAEPEVFEAEAAPELTSRRGIQEEPEDDGPVLEQPADIGEAQAEGGIGGNQTDAADIDEGTEEEDSGWDLTGKLSSAFNSIGDWIKGNMMMVLIAFIVLLLLAGTAFNVYYFYIREDEDYAEEDADISEFIDTENTDNGETIAKSSPGEIPRKRKGSHKRSRTATKKDKKTETRKKKEVDDKGPERPVKEDDAERAAHPPADTTQKKDEAPAEETPQKQAQPEEKNGWFFSRFMKKRGIKAAEQVETAEEAIEEEEKELIPPKPSDVKDKKEKDPKKTEKPKAEKKPEPEPQETAKEEPKKSTEKKTKEEKPEHIIKHLEEVKVWGRAQIEAGFTYGDMKAALKETGYTGKEVKRIISIIKEEQKKK